MGVKPQRQTQTAKEAPPARWGLSFFSALSHSALRHSGEKPASPVILAKARIQGVLQSPPPHLQTRAYGFRLGGRNDALGGGGIPPDARRGGSETRPCNMTRYSKRHTRRLVGVPDTTSITSCRGRSLSTRSCRRTGTSHRQLRWRTPFA